ncbi:penicillin-binding protein activator LpoB [Sedimentisphaera salicampi]|uniref:Penicillin-binding protein activator LpoB n=1 Tax=Sedimentisphaera salicampi TaxID=1941349 RepID=A0A1W6LP98_9BACT|nr:penicillin-binding protein activator LpoB [Sedimentisphaera salicampi]ARN57562.1 putative lipoprotein [Sedimentisphaera salicampi]OXU14424.1 putative lipoprotein [Sedimentisphaera salicampi]
MKKAICLIAVSSFVLLAGCTSPTRNIDVRNDEGKAVMALDYRDFDQAASRMVQDMVQKGVLTKPDGSRYVVATGDIKNDTTQYFDTDQLMAKIESEMLNTGKVVFTSAVSGRKEGATDKMIEETRKLRESDEFDQSTTIDKGRLIAPELSISGKIIQRNISYDQNTQQVEYYFQLSLTDLTTGMRYWQNEVVLGKRGSSKSVSW